MTEQQIQAKIIKFLETEYDAYTVKVITATKSGVPDIICCVEGMFVGIEVKRPSTKNNVSKLQMYNLAKIEKAGGLGFVAYNTEIVKEYIDNLLGRE